MNKQGFVQVTQEYDQVKKNIDQKNFLLQTKLKDLRQISPKFQKSPITQLQEQLGLDRKQVIEQFKPIVEKEGIYLRNERLKTETQLQQSKMQEIQQKNESKIDRRIQFRSNQKKRIILRKIKEVRGKIIIRNGNEQTNCQQKMFEISKLKIRKELIEEIQSAKTKEQQLCNKFCNSLVSNDNSLILPSIQKSFSKMSQNSTSKQQRKGCSPIQKQNKVIERLQRSETRNENSIVEQEDNRKGCLESRKKSQSIDQLNIACQTSFLITHQNLESIQYSLNYDSYMSSQKDKTTEKSITNLTSDETKDYHEKNRQSNKNLMTNMNYCYITIHQKNQQQVLISLF